MDELEDHIAIVGIGCNFPGGEGIDNFWKVIVEGRNCTIEIPKERFNTKNWYDSNGSNPGKICTRRAALVEGMNEFDNNLFRIHSSETETMDPQHKLLLECTYRALENAGYPTESISGSKTGVFIGLMNRDADSIYNNSPDNINHFNGTGTSSCIAANRISYCFNFTGPSLSIDTACSSSLVALHYACQAIRQGDCEMAICGGVSCIMEPRVYVALSKAKMISPEGTSKPFSSKADGYGRGEGCGIVLLKPLKKAKEEFCNIWGIIHATAVNQDGRSVTPITKPSQHQQEELLQSIYRIIDPCSVQYVEAHGTGTPVGDPIEVTSIGNIIGKKRPSGMKPLKIGSVKGNIGHTESAAGMAGLIKVLLMMHHEVIPPSLHYTKELGIKKIEESNLIVPTSPEKWQEDVKFGRIAGINCFGFGGTNTHVVVKKCEQIYPQCHSERPVEIFILSAASRKSLQLSIEDTKRELNKPTSVSLENLVYTAACRRSHLSYKYRTAFLTSSLTHLHQQLQSVNTETPPAKGSPQIVYVLCGNGVLYKGMCKMLLEHEPVFKDKCLEINEMIQVYTTLSVVELLEKECDDFSSPDVAQLLLFTLQVSLVALLRYWGIKPDCIVGHSVGEVAAAHCSGLLSLEDAVKVIYFRSTLQCKVTGGKMLVVGNLPVTEISKLTVSYNGKVCIAAYNSPTSCTISGDGESIQDLHEKVTKHYSKNNIFLHVLDVPTAYHSHLMDPILSEIKNILQDLKPQKMETELISTVTGKPASKGDFTTGDYWAKNIREPVAFEQAVQISAKDKEHPIYIEIGPRRALQRNILETLGSNTIILPVVQPKKEYETIFSMLMMLFTAGYNPDWGNIYKLYKSSPAGIPRYQFDHIKQDINFEKIRQGSMTVATAIHPLLHGIGENFTEFRCTVSKALTPYIYEHKNLGSVLVPGTFYVELGLAATATSLIPKVPLSSLEISVTFSRPCVLRQDYLELNVKLQREDQITHFDVLTSHLYANGQIKINHCKTKISQQISIEHIFKRCHLIFKKEKIYEQLYKFGFEYGKAYRQLVDDIHYGDVLKEAITRIRVSEEVRETMYEYHIHPVILDCFLQMVVCVGDRDKDTTAIFPSSIGSLTVFQPFQEEMILYIQLIKTTKNYFELCGCFADNNGMMLVELKNVKMSFVKQTEAKQENTFFQVTWTQTPQSIDIPEQKPNMLIYADNYGVSQQLSKYIHDGLSFISFQSWDSDIQIHKILQSECKDVVFMWGIQALSKDIPTNLTQYLAKCCEVYRQLILAVSQWTPKATIRTVTLRNTRNTLDDINPGFALIGMTRACIIEKPNITFQLIDISSSSPEDVEALGQVLLNYKPNDYPEIWINEGCIYTSEIIPTNTENCRQQITTLEKSDYFTLYTAEPYTVTGLTAEQTHLKHSQLTDKWIEIMVDQICIHAEDYFPVSMSSWKYGNTLYWSTLSNEEHELIALDFAGTVTSIGENVKKIQVGDRITACYPTVATSKVRLPENVCYLVRKVPMLRNAPCVSLFVLAWEVFCHQLPHAKNKPKLGIMATEIKSVLCTVLSKTAKQVGWETVISQEITADFIQCSAMIILPSPDVVSAEALFKLPLLKHVIVICGHSNHESYQNLALSCRQDIHVHLLYVAAIFQKANLQKFAKDIYKWLQSLSVDIHLILPKNMIQPSCSTKNITTSYFTAQCVPLIELDNNTISRITLSSSDPVLFRHNAVYIVTGGLTGLGFETVKFIVRNGGGHIVILSRRHPTPEIKKQISEVQNERENTNIITLPCNISYYSEVKNAIKSIQKMFPNFPIRGIFHSAVVLHDGVLQNLNLSLFEKVLSPKVDGTVNLHCATIDQKLDYFVCYSSVASFIGNPGQANYAAANSFLDMFCQYRRNIGLSGQSINWGGLNLGVLLNQHQIHKLLQAKGILLLNTEEIHEYLKLCLLLNNNHQAIVKFDFKTMYANLISNIPSLKKRFYNVMVEKIKSWEDTPKIKESSKTNEIPEDYILLLISELTNVSSRDIASNSLLNFLGIDSMLAMTLQNRIFMEKNVNVPLVTLLDPNTSISMLVSEVQKNISNEEKPVQRVIEETKL
ncbi:mycolipanoate synthase-like [Pseudophryne corroboree]|uniref:mycolipanoate synthase-like n=1 Tax=Pseudophryne corroboree TaxID=495146 RepID=UPI0030817734